MGLTWGSDTWRATPAAVASDPLATAGPALREETDYKVVLRAEDGQRVELKHRDPLILANVENHTKFLAIGMVNFGSQVGRSTFEVEVDGQPEFTFNVEVMPSKLGYQSDYDAMMAEVQTTLSSLAFEFLRATWKGAEEFQKPDPTTLEWVVLLKRVANELDRALRHVAQQPVRGLTRTATVRRVDQIRRVDSTVRRHLRKQITGKQTIASASGLVLPERVPEHRAHPTLDTPEHGWLAAQVDRIRRRLGELSCTERARQRNYPSERRGQAVKELTALESQVALWSRLEPIEAASQHPPPGFSSLQLMGASGYREAFRACLTLGMGLRITGGPMQLSVKDLHQLYEYWCFLAVLRCVSLEFGARIDPRDLIAVEQDGLKVRLRQGKSTRVAFPLGDGRHLAVTYNPQLGSHGLVPQKPDILLSVTDKNWPEVHLVLDAKYRLDGSPEYAQRYKTPGPPEDALNAMHRYRDAILHTVDTVPHRTVVQAAALFPWRDEKGDFETGKLWRALETIGVGAIPFLPEQDNLIRRWLRTVLRSGSWRLADRAVEHVASRKASDWRRQASEPVLVGALRGDDPAGHLAWIRETHQYYTPYSETQIRLFTATQVAFYEPTGGKAPGAVTSAAAIRSMRVVRRLEILTPWPARQGTQDERFVLYALGDLQTLPQAIVNDARWRIGSRWWTSRLALGRATRLPELLLETEAEWQLSEALMAAGMDHEVRAAAPAGQGEEVKPGRARFEISGLGRVQWRGAAGFAASLLDGAEVSIGVNASQAANWLGHRMALINRIASDEA
jgi:predicted component of viral defense system (DUF524 family)